MTLKFAISGSDGRKQLESLESWLRIDSTFRGCTRSEGTPTESDLGTGIELLTVAIGGGGVISVLATSLSSWLQQPRRSAITLKVTGPNGLTVEIDAKRAKPEEVLKLLSRAMEEGRRSAE